MREHLRAGHIERFSASGAVDLGAGATASGARLGDEDDDGDGPTRFDMLAYTGVEIARNWGRMVVSVEGITRDARSCMLLEHQDMVPVGVADEHQEEKGALRLRGYMLSAEASPHAGRLVLQAREGLPLKASIGIRFGSVHEIRAGDSETVNGRPCKGPMTVVDESFLFECSFIHANPADLGTSATVMRATSPKLRARRMKALCRDERRARWLRGAAEIMRPTFGRAGLGTKHIDLQVDECSGTFIGETFHLGGGRALVKVAPEVCTTRQATLVLLHELAHACLSPEAAHGPGFHLAVERVGLVDGGHKLGAEGHQLADRIEARLGEYPR